jgi:hypothetical protein
MIAGDQSALACLRTTGSIFRMECEIIRLVVLQIAQCLGFGRTGCTYIGSTRSRRLFRHIYLPDRIKNCLPMPQKLNTKRTGSSSGISPIYQQNIWMSTQIRLRFTRNLFSPYPQPHREKDMYRNIYPQTVSGHIDLRAAIYYPKSGTYLENDYPNVDKRRKPFCKIRETTITPIKMKINQIPGGY